MSTNVDIPTDHMPWDRPYNEAELIADAARYRTLKIIGPSWYKQIWIEAETQEQFDSAVDAASQQVSGMAVGV